jgi:uncharacterized coiled-coil protein SlyX
MKSKTTYQKRIESQLTKWKTTIVGLSANIEQAEAAARAKLLERLDRLNEKRAKGEKLLEKLSATSEEAWEEMKSGIEQGWNEVTRTAKQAAAKMRKTIEHPTTEDEIRQIAYQLWLDEGCPHGRDRDHWFKAESVWREQQTAKQPAKAKRKPAAAAPQAKGRPAKSKSASGGRSINRGEDKT